MNPKTEARMLRNRALIERHKAERALASLDDATIEIIRTEHEAGASIFSLAQQFRRSYEYIEAIVKYRKRYPGIPKELAP